MAQIDLSVKSLPSIISLIAAEIGSTAYLSTHVIKQTAIHNILGRAHLSPTYYYYTKFDLLFA